MLTNIQVKIKKISDNAVIPSYSKPGDAGLDLVATWCLPGQGFIEYGTGLSIEIPIGFVGLIYPRSSISNYDLILSNHVGVIDSGYRGEIKLRFRRNGSKIYEPGDRIGQLIITQIPKVELEEVLELSGSERGAGGYGSTGL